MGLDGLDEPDALSDAVCGTLASQQMSGTFCVIPALFSCFLRFGLGCLGVGCKQGTRNVLSSRSSSP